MVSPTGDDDEDDDEPTPLPPPIVIKPRRSQGEPSVEAGAPGASKPQRGDRAAARPALILREPGTQTVAAGDRGADAEGDGQRSRRGRRRAMG
jgi:hypothetical protein